MYSPCGRGLAARRRGIPRNPPFGCPAAPPRCAQRHRSYPAPRRRPAKSNVAVRRGHPAGLPVTLLISSGMVPRKRLGWDHRHRSVEVIISEVSVETGHSNSEIRMSLVLVAASGGHGSELNTRCTATLGVSCGRSHSRRACDTRAIVGAAKSDTPTVRHNLLGDAERGERLAGAARHDQAAPFMIPHGSVQQHLRDSVGLKRPRLLYGALRVALFELNMQVLSEIDLGRLGDGHSGSRAPRSVPTGRLPRSSAGGRPAVGSRRGTCRCVPCRAVRRSSKHLPGSATHSPVVLRATGRFRCPDRRGRSGPCAAASRPSARFRRSRVPASWLASRMNRCSNHRPFSDSSRLCARIRSKISPAVGFPARSSLGWSSIGTVPVSGAPGSQNDGRACGARGRR